MPGLSHLMRIHRPEDVSLELVAKVGGVTVAPFMAVRAPPKENIKAAQRARIIRMLELVFILIKIRKTTECKGVYHKLIIQYSRVFGS